MMGLAGKLMGKSSNISFVSAASAAGANTLTLPTYAVGDVFVFYAYNNAANTVPTLPTGWTNVISNGNSTSNIAGRVAIRVATGSDAVGNWTNATDVLVLVYRGVRTSDPIGGINFSTQGTSGIALSWISVNSKLGSTSWFIALAGTSGTTGINLATPPTGMVNRTTAIGASNSCVGHDTNSAKSRYPSSGVSLNQTVFRQTFTLELVSA